MVILLLFSFNTSSGLQMDKGSLCKFVLWENGNPIVGATVGLDLDGDGRIDFIVQTDRYGQACFDDVEYGTHHIYVDINNDNVWDTSAEPVHVFSEYTELTNLYPLSSVIWRPN